MFIIAEKMSKTIIKGFRKLCNVQLYGFDNKPVLTYVAISTIFLLIFDSVYAVQ